MPSFIKIGSGVLAPRGVEICHFPMLSAIAYIYNRLGLPPNYDTDSLYFVLILTYVSSAS